MIKKNTSSKLFYIIAIVCCGLTANAKDLKIEGATEVEAGDEVWYDINFDVANEVEWWVQGGHIIEIEDAPIQKYVYSQDEYGFGIWDFKSDKWTVVSDDKKYAQIMNYFGPVYGLTFSFGGGGKNPFAIFEGSQPPEGTVVDLPGGSFTIPPDVVINTSGPKTDVCIGYCSGFLLADRKTKRVKIKWDSYPSVASIRVKGTDLSNTPTGGQEVTQNIYICQKAHNNAPEIFSNGTVKKCTEGLNLSTHQKEGQNYHWSSNGGHIAQQWGHRWIYRLFFKNWRSYSNDESIRSMFRI